MLIVKKSMLDFYSILISRNIKISTIHFPCYSYVYLKQKNFSAYYTIVLVLKKHLYSIAEKNDRSKYAANFPIRNLFLIASNFLLLCLQSESNSA